jgi:hypothetical protein
MSGLRAKGVRAWFDRLGPFTAELVIDEARIDISTLGPKLDPTWCTFDAAGHWHAYDTGGKTYPTLRLETRTVECDGACGGDCDGCYSVSTYHCRICSEEVRPGQIPGPHYDSMPGLTSWHLNVTDPNSPAEWPDRVTVRVEVGAAVRFGIGRPSLDGFEAGKGWTIRVHGENELGMTHTTSDRPPTSAGNGVTADHLASAPGAHGQRGGDVSGPATSPVRSAHP